MVSTTLMLNAAILLVEFLYNFRLSHEQSSLTRIVFAVSTVPITIFPMLQHYVVPLERWLKPWYQCF